MVFGATSIFDQTQFRTPWQQRVIMSYATTRQRRFAHGDPLVGACKTVYVYQKGPNALVSASASLTEPREQTKCPHPAPVPRNQCFPQSLQHWDVVEAQCRKFPGTHLGSKEARAKKLGSYMQKDRDEDTALHALPRHQHRQDLLR